MAVHEFHPLHDPGCQIHRLRNGSLFWEYSLIPKKFSQALGPLWIHMQGSPIARHGICWCSTAQAEECDQVILWDVDKPVWESQLQAKCACGMYFERFASNFSVHECLYICLYTWFMSLHVITSDLLSYHLQFSHVQELRNMYGHPLNESSCYPYEAFYKIMRQAITPGTRGITAQVFTNVSWQRSLAKANHSCERNMRIVPAIDGRKRYGRYEDR